ncbi:MAG: transporter ATP-binding protein [Herbaspirillum sp.]|jgi:iron complex transport system ATP-binding protein|nr:transporter ATP-binding protein [Herbaspirillum sp.]
MMHTTGLDLNIGAKKLVAALDWRIAPGQCWCVIGANGVGKTTLLRALAGLQPPSAGSVQLDGRPVKDWSPAEQALRRAYLPPGRDDAFAYPVLAAVLAARHPHRSGSGWESDQDRDIALAALERLGVTHLAQRDVRTLSGGQRQRVALAALLAQQAPLLIMDEPTSAMDLAGRVGAMKLLAELCRDESKSVILVSHDLNLAHGAASHALLLMGDGAWQAGTVADMMTIPLLSRCLGHPIEIVQHQGRPVYVAQEDLA